MILRALTCKLPLGFFGSSWAGFKNFKFLFNSDDALHATRNTLLYNAVFILLGTAITVGAALMLFELGKRHVKLYQSVMFFPYFLSWVLVSYVFMSLLDFPHFAPFAASAYHLAHNPFHWKNHHGHE